MGRGKGSLRANAPKLHRRLLMELLPPCPRTACPRFLYAPNRHLDVPALLPPPMAKVEAEIVVPPDHFTLANPCVRARQLWGHATYTDDSDVVAAAAHAGAALLPTTRLSVEHAVLRVRLTRHDGTAFRATVCHGLRSREWAGGYSGALLRPLTAHFVGPVGCAARRPRLAGVPARIPGLVPAIRVRVETGTGPSGKKGKRESGGGEGVGIMFDACNEPCLRYELRVVAAESVADRLEKEVIYVEGVAGRFEVSGDARAVRFARVKKEAVKGGLTAGLCGGEKGSIPLDKDDVEVVVEDVPWADLFWDQDGVTLRNVHYDLTKVSFRDKSIADDKEGDEEHESTT